MAKLFKAYIITPSGAFIEVLYKYSPLAFPNEQEEAVVKDILSNLGEATSVSEAVVDTSVIIHKDGINVLLEIDGDHIQNG